MDPPIVNKIVHFLIESVSINNLSFRNIILIKFLILAWLNIIYYMKTNFYFKYNFFTEIIAEKIKVLDFERS